MTPNLYLDLDGTLLDVADRYWNVHVDTMADLGCAPVERARYWASKRRGLPESEIVRAAVVDRAAMDRYLETRDIRLETARYLAFDRPVVPDLDGVLAMLADRFAVSLVTLRKDRCLLNDQLHRLGLQSKFVSVLSPRAGRERTSRDARLKAALLRDHHAPAGDDMIVGDTEADVHAGRELGIRTCGVLSGLRDEASLLALKPDRIIRDIADLVENRGNPSARRETMSRSPLRPSDANQGRTC